MSSLTFRMIAEVCPTLQANERRVRSQISAEDENIASIRDLIDRHIGSVHVRPMPGQSSRRSHNFRLDTPRVEWRIASDSPHVKNIVFGVNKDVRRWNDSNRLDHLRSGSETRGDFNCNRNYISRVRFPGGQGELWRHFPNGLKVQYFRAR